MSRFRFVSAPVLGGITRLLPCSAQDEGRFRALGFPAGRLFTTGNIKLDLQLETLEQGARAQLRKELGLGTGLVILGSSTWPGEEAALLAAWKAARTDGIDCSLLLVPRHAERRGEIEQMLGDAQVAYHFRSRGAAVSLVDVAVADTTGELRKLTQLADLVFVGKSLPPNEGGQTPVEAAALEKPLLFGPGMSNFRLIAADLVNEGAALVVSDATEVQRQVVELLRSPSKRASMSKAAGHWQRRNSGAVERTIAVIREELAKLPV
jgi:3-deoxy-D-manno-octulosonic-acid transferase